MKRVQFFWPKNIFRRRDHLILSAFFCCCLIFLLPSMKWNAKKYEFLFYLMVLTFFLRFLLLFLYKEEDFHGLVCWFDIKMKYYCTRFYLRFHFVLRLVWPLRVLLMCPLKIFIFLHWNLTILTFYTYYLMLYVI